MLTRIKFRKISSIYFSICGVIVNRFNLNMGSNPIKIIHCNRYFVYIVMYYNTKWHDPHRLWRFVTVSCSLQQGEHNNKTYPISDIIKLLSYISEIMHLFVQLYCSYDPVALRTNSIINWNSIQVLTFFLYVLFQTNRFVEIFEFLIIGNFCCLFLKRYC